MSAFVLKYKVIALVAGAVVVGGSPAIAGDAARTPELSLSRDVPAVLVNARPAAAPRGFLDFCRRRPTECMEAGSSETAQEITSRASRLYWAGVFGRAPQSGAPATTSVPADARLSSADWHRVFATSMTPTADLPDVAAPPAMAVEVSHEKAAPYESTVGDVRATYSLVSGPYVEATVAESLMQDWAKAQPTSFSLIESDGSALIVRLAASVPAMTALAAPMNLPADLASTPANRDVTRLSTLFPPVAPAVESAQTRQASAGAEGVSISLDRAGWALVNGVNRDMNRRIRQSSDIRAFGVEDFWQVPGGSNPRGDCEDYVLAKRRALIAQGIPAAALSIAIVKTSWGESHAVLLLAADGGEFVLDNLTPWISRRERVNYDWQERQAPGKVFEWVRMAA